jgi:osmoprotectant transport system permease protein
MTDDKRRNPVLASLSVLMVLALSGLPFLQLAPNRLVSGQPLYFFSIIHGSAWSLLMVLVMLAALVLLTTLLLVAMFKPRTAWLWAVLTVAAVCMPSLLWLAANQASISLQGELPIARTSLGSAFWVALVLLGLMVSSAVQQLRLAPLQTVAVCAAILLLFVGLLASGACDDLSLMKEYANRADGFVEVALRHVQIVLLALAFTLAIGLPLGWAVHTQVKMGRVLLPVLNIIQTIPSIALFGLLMAPLALLAGSVPALGRAGISGVGLAPAVIALTLYGLLPVVRGTLAGLQQVPSAMVQAGRALGLTRFQTLIHIELPLALPVLLGGVRTAAVSSVGLAAVTALIGAGGLGSVLFEGLFANAQDVVLLGVMPIIALGVVVDALFKALMGLAWWRVHPW